MTLYSSNKSGRRGVQVVFVKTTQETKYFAQITLMPGVTKRLGYFATLKEASDAYEAEAKLRDERKKVRRALAKIKREVRRA